MADLNCIKTTRGGIISIHWGSEVSTNLWDRYGWMVITDPVVKDKLKEIEKYDSSDADHARILIAQLHKDIPNPYKVGRKYTRGMGVSTTSATVEKSTEPPVPVITPEEAEKIVAEAASVKPEPAPAPKPAPDERELKRARKNVATQIIKFFSEFTFDPSIRFVNTLIGQRNPTEARQYAACYFALCDHPDANAIKDKIKSDEFEMILTEAAKCKSDRKINNRLEIFFGPAGTGKTTKACQMYPEAKVTVCNENMDSTDLMKTFAFNDENGNPTFKPSSLQEDMIAGRPHILDEINLLPLSSLRYLQGILDGKKEIDFEGKTITIAEGFKIIGTMNLIVNGQVFNLPEPLVDRASVLNEYQVTPDILADCAF